MVPIFLLMNRMATRRRIVRKSVKSVKPEKKALDADYCRTCLGTEGLVAIFNSKDSEKMKTEDLKLVTGLDIKINDGLPQKICNKCVEIIHTALQFRRTSKKSEKTLLNMFYGKPKKSSIKISKHIKKSPEKEIIKEDVDFDYGDMFENGFQDEVDFSYQVDEVTPTKNSETTISKGRKKREVIPNAASYKCNTCNKEFRMKATYKAHIRFHTNYCVCESCGKRCRNNNQLQEHKRARHGLGRIHKCAYCEYSSATKEALTIHERRHTGERPYVCDHCGATFHRRSNLVQHIAIHLPEKNFQCDMCPKRLKSRKFLQIHKHNAHTGKRYGYLCPICEHRFEKPNKVRAHTRRVHGLPDDQQGAIVRVQL
ncbi:GDNF-inducible zinc finger protein 1-like [Melitaea cinxia]|uniref:GDNF-inducible zinc finger protein 1-like n=1 Tax=Melitaea cinxia TaxID=113334 RepID=UPI001E270E46|nr:GDNF-inducible zinc finger protein 1-like [Melitaea cinxia]